MFVQDDTGRTLPKFGEWDVNNPASADGFTVIFSKARDEKKAPTKGHISNRSVDSKDSRTTDNKVSYNSRNNASSHTILRKLNELCNAEEERNAAALVLFYDGYV
ncbi:hypothetical protein BAE44_0000605 [Dichanthelium oligosanthes]|uniref:RIN4 pathogenic type III effector avirulence factor Avr cleavage site domain-containing protein n=1 Tax=Dichanthelium oligosanthes TaxID=888268 RepID=A0A1E5WLY1_9POAL|nr:hypothetical protein BAE44_0000605 [Dichanthelium oligosanthes]